jgi:hypothetical protein
MEIVGSVIDFVKSPAGAGLFAGLLLISEALASIKSIEENSVLQVVMTVLKKLAEKPE